MHVECADVLPSGGCTQDCSLTAGDIDDNLNFVTYEIYKKRTFDAESNGIGQTLFLPNPDLSDRLSVTVRDDQGNTYSCATVDVSGGAAELSAGSDGKLAFFSEIDSLPSRPWMLQATSPDGATMGATVEVSDTDASVELTIPSTSVLPTKMDLAVVLDTTGSMCDEITFLQDELASVISSFTGGANRTIDLRVAMVYYKDEGDEYVVSTSGFTTPDEATKELSNEFCNGGGDYPEAVHTAWDMASKQDWRTGNVARVALLIGDAPPHRENMAAALEAAKVLRMKGVRMYGLAASGVDNALEYLLRMVALLSGGRHSWLTSDSSIGNDKKDAKVACFQVTNMENLLTRVLLGELEGKRFDPDPSQIIREEGNQTAGICLVDMNNPEASLKATGNSESGVGLGLCFPGNQIVDVKGTGQVAMKNIKLGDMVSVGSGKYARVYSFGHYNTNIEAEYVQIYSQALERPLEISKDHMVFVENNSIKQALPASAISIGDNLVMTPGGSTTVTKILLVTRKGAFAPFTTSGTVVVNGVVASSYVSLQDKLGVVMIGDFATPISMQWLAHSFQAPHRIFLCNPLE